MTSLEIERAADAIRIEKQYSFEKIRAIIFEQTGEDVSLVTVKNFFSGKTENPNYHTIHIMLQAVGAKLNVITEISENAINENTVEDFRESIRIVGEENARLQDKINDIQKKNEDLIRSDVEKTAELAAAKESARWGKRVITVLLAVLLILVLSILILCIIDMSRADVGWFRTISESIHAGGMSAYGGQL